ncbi:hypothetical protein HZU77_014035 [Neisseriaceae bacterium TC5R-5]|nr:hypothetical protein [Neisseriaceae bacterium TC5R-5]
MNDIDFSELRKVAQSIRADATDLKLPDVAVSNFGKAVGFLFEEIYEGDGLTMQVNPHAFAHSLHILAAKITAKY